MSWWMIVTLVLAVWLLAGFVLALFLGPHLNRNGKRYPTPERYRSSAESD